MEEVKKGGTTRRGKPLKTSRGVSLGLGVRNSIRWALNNDQRIWVWVVGMIVVINFVLARMETDAGTTDIPNETEAPIEQLISDEQMAELTATMEKLITEQDKPISPDEGGLNEG
ncbi:MAG: hypothetical protein HQ475_09325 [SAR202 cluster bacterium]|nr:hypothetical protein [SAR202 cluster bacterium]